MQFLDACSIVRVKGKPDLFITMTSNPKWPEVMSQLGNDELPQDRPDILTRVYKQKLDGLINDLHNGSLFGDSSAHLAIAEFQKTGLTHAHILLILRKEHKLITNEQIDDIICAELPPDPSLTENEEERKQMQLLQDMVTRNMIHGPCGISNPKAQCMNDGKCKKGYPKPYAKHTVVDPGHKFTV